MGRRLGQHFLKNKGEIKQIADSLELQKGDVVIEIGAGHGELTRELESRIQNLEARIIAIEKDRNLAHELIKQFERSRKVEIIEGDALKIFPNHSRFYSLDSRFYKIVGNIPYYITGKLLRILGELESKPELIVLTVQKEVALRITAKPPRMNLLAASVQFWAKPEIVGFIPKKDFSPPPEVDSAIVKFKIKNSKLKIEDFYYYKSVKILFKQPRKTILNNLSAGLRLNKEEIIRKLETLKINPLDRPQNVDVKSITKLARILYN